MHAKSLQSCPTLTISLNKIRPLYSQWECKLVQLVWKTVWRFLRKLKIELPYDPAIPLLGTYPEKTVTHKDSGTAIFIAALFTITKPRKQTKCPSAEEWIKMWYTHTVEHYLATNSNESVPFAETRMDLKTVILHLE